MSRMSPPPSRTDPGARAVDADGSDYRRPLITVPHPLECRRPRPRRALVWTPSRDWREAGRPRRSVAERWHDPVLSAEESAGPVRINFTYANWISTVAGFSAKAGRAQYFEGPVEPAAWIESEVLTHYTGLSFQPLQVTWRRADGGTRATILDGGFETEDGDLIFDEYKATEEFLENSETEDLLDEAEKVLAANGAGLRRRTGTELLTPVRHRVLKDVFDDRRTTLDAERDEAAVLEAIYQAGVAAPLGRVLEALGGRPRDASAKANALMCRRRIRIDLSRPQMRDTPVDVPPPPAAPDRLRDFLRRHARELDPS